MKNIFIVALVLLACNNAEKKEVATVQKKTFPSSWIVGKWMAKDSSATLTETWSMLNDSTLESNVWKYSGSDSVLSEILHISFDRSGTFFRPIMIDNNRNINVVFSLNSLDTNELAFENFSNNFPQIISYKKIHQDSIVATIRNADTSSNTMKVSWGYKRVK